MSKASAVLCASIIGISLGEVLQPYHFMGNGVKSSKYAMDVEAK